MQRDKERRDCSNWFSMESYTSHHFVSEQSTTAAGMGCSNSRQLISSAVDISSHVERNCNISI